MQNKLQGIVCPRFNELLEDDTLSRQAESSDHDSIPPINEEESVSTNPHLCKFNII